MVKRRKGKKCIFSYSQIIFFDIKHEINVYDRDKDNVLVSAGGEYGCEYKEAFYTISKEEIDKIKDLIRNSKYIFNDKELEESDICVIDGSEDTIYLSVDNKKVKIIHCNFFLEYKDFSKNTKAGELYNICTNILSVLKDNGIEKI